MAAHSDPPAAIRVDGLRKAFGRRRVLDGVDLAVAPGTVHALLGANGAGKTTLVRILATLLRPDAGAAVVGGHDVVRDPQGVRRAIGVTGQHTSVDELLTGAENLRMMARLAGFDRRAARARADELLATFGLEDAAGRRAGTYSGGMRRRLDLAASLVAGPRILYLDEPTTGLDARSRLGLWQLVAELRDRGTTILLTTQILDEADRLADRVAMLGGGRVVAEGTPDELKRWVGAELLELAFASAADRAAAAEALAVAGARPPATAEPRVLQVPTDGSGDHVRHVLDRLAAHGVHAEHVTTRRPSLDDVFLVLTEPGGGRPAGDLAVAAP